MLSSGQCRRASGAHRSHFFSCLPGSGSGPSGPGSWPSLEGSGFGFAGITPCRPSSSATWEREDTRLRVIRRDLNYRGWPEHPPREKGVDVTLAIALVESAMLNKYDVAIVFSDDTDLIPAVEMAFRTEMAAGRWLLWCHFLG